MTPQEITLDRTGDRPATFRGEMVTSFKSGNATAADRESSAKQWFVINLYQTISGTYVAHIQYRAGSKLGRELPKDIVISDKVLLTLFDAIKTIDAAADFVTPRNAISQRAELADAARWHETSCRYSRREFTDVVNNLSHYVTKVGGAEEIL